MCYLLWAIWITRFFEHLSAITEWVDNIFVPQIALFTSISIAEIPTKKIDQWNNTARMKRKKQNQPTPNNDQSCDFIVEKLLAKLSNWHRQYHTVFIAISAFGFVRSVPIIDSIDFWSSFFGRYFVCDVYTVHVQYNIQSNDSLPILWLRRNYWRAKQNWHEQYNNDNNSRQKKNL